MGLVAWCNGSDGEYGIGDDNLFNSLVEVDAVSYVGAVALKVLYDYVEVWILSDGSVDPVEEKLLVFLNYLSTNFEMLDLDVGFNKIVVLVLIIY